MSCVPSAARVPSITARPTADEKQRFAELASSRGISESALALIAIRFVLQSNAPLPANALAEDHNAPATDRITIRLRPRDRIAIGERAAGRGLKDSAYIAALVRAHVSRNPPMPGAELATLKKAVAVLAALGSLLARMHRDAGVSADLRLELRRTQVVATAVEQSVQVLAKASLESWESGYG